MKINLFGIFEYRPFWEKQHIDDDYIGIILLIGIFGFTISSWLVLITFALYFSIGFLESIDLSTNSIFFGIQNIWINIIVSILAAFIALNLILKYSTVYDDYPFREEMNRLKDDISDVSNDNLPFPSNAIFVLIIAFAMLVGTISGVIYSIILLIPYFVVFILLVFILNNFISLSPALFFMAFISSWAFVMSYVIRRKLQFQEVEVRKPSNQLVITKRDVEILHSDEPPIICGNCRSFVPADKKICPVCNEKIENNN